VFQLPPPGATQIYGRPCEAFSVVDTPTDARGSHVRTRKVTGVPAFHFLSHVGIICFVKKIYNKNELKFLKQNGCGRNLGTKTFHIIEQMFVKKVSEKIKQKFVKKTFKT
jgi:hypothetical protein